MMGWDLIQSGMKSCCLSTKCHLTHILESWYKTQLREYDQLKHVLALYDPDVLQKDMQPSYQRLKTTVKTFLDQKTRTRRPETKEPCQGHRRKAEAKGSQSASSENREMAIRGKQKGSVQREMLAVFATIPVNVEQAPVLLFPLQNRRRTMVGKILQNVDHPEEAVHPVKGARGRAEIALMVIARTNRVMFGTLLCVKTTNHTQAASLAKSVRSYTWRRTDSRRKQRGWRKKACRNSSGCEASRMCIPRCGAAESQFAFTEGHQFIETKKTCTMYVKYFPSATKRERKQSLEVIQPSHPRELSFFAPEFEERSQENTLAQERWARRVVRDLAKKREKVSRRPGRNQGNILLTFRGVVSSCAIID